MDAVTGTVKTELRGHENVVEAIAFVPPNAVPSVRDLVCPIHVTRLPFPDLPLLDVHKGTTGD
jgi:hypothetical protein